MFSFVKECYKNVKETISAVQGEDIDRLEQISEKCRKDTGEGALKFGALIIRHEICDCLISDEDSVLGVLDYCTMAPVTAVTGVCTVVNGICSVVSGIAANQQKLLSNPMLVRKLHTDISLEEKRQILAQLNI